MEYTDLTNHWRKKKKQYLILHVGKIIFRFLETRKEMLRELVEIILHRPDECQITVYNINLIFF